MAAGDVWFTAGTRRGGAPEGALHGRALDSHGFTLDSVDVTLEHLTAGPADVVGLRRGAVRRRVPHPGTLAAEEEQRPYVELGAADLPWRYAPGDTPGQRTRPWLFLVVAPATEIRPAGGAVSLSPGVQARHPLARADLWAHVQRGIEGGAAETGVARVLAGTAFPRWDDIFDNDTDYVAALVVPWTADGAPAWPDGGAATPVVVACLDWWTYRTGGEGTFKTLALELHPADDDPVGTVEVLVPANAGGAGDPEVIRVGGALITIRAADGPEPEEHRFDILRPAEQPPRVVVGAPAQGAPWAGERPVRDRVAAAEAIPEIQWSWPEQVNADLHLRVPAAVGTRAGIDLQEEVVLAANRAWRAGPAVSAVLASLALGLSATRSAWQSRVATAGPESRLRLLGPAAGRIPADDADGPTGQTVRFRLARPGDPQRAALPVELIGPTGRRVLRAGGPAARHAGDGAIRPAVVLSRSTQVEDVPERPRDAVDRFGTNPADIDPAHADAAAHDVEAEYGPQGRQQALRNLGEGAGVPANVDLDDLRPAGERVPARPVDLRLLADLLTDGLDPMTGGAPALRRVAARVSGVDPPHLMLPLEDCPTLDLPAWRYLRDHAPHWLLPGADTLSAGEVAALRTNPEFIEAFLLGFNQQTLAELRWREHPVRAGCTPLRRFWERHDEVADPKADPLSAPLDDITGIAGWLAADGAPVGRVGTHPPSGVSPEKLVIVIRTELFRLYPSTLVSLAEDNGAGQADLTKRTWPTFISALSTDLTMFAFNEHPTVVSQRWVVVEEVPDGIRFGVHPDRRDPLDPSAEGSTSDGGDRAADLLVRPIRILLPGSETVVVSE